MNRLTKKCMIASAGMHALLLVVLMVGAAFTSKNKVEPMPPVITLVNAIITDGPTRGGGNPNVQQPPPAAAEPAAAAPQPAAQPPQRNPEPEPEPAPPEPPQAVKQPDPPKIVETAKAKEPDVEVPKEPAKDSFTFRKVDAKTKKTTEKATDTKPTQQFELTKANRKATSNTANPTSKGISTSRQNDISKELGKSIGSIASSIRGAASSSTSFEVQGSGGQAYVNYGHAIVNIYQRAYDRALTLAGEIADGDDSVDVAVTIAKDGRIVTSRITRNSRNTKLNNLVKGVLDRVDSVPDFPPGARDAQRTINITFDLKSRRLTG